MSEADSDHVAPTDGKEIQDYNYQIHVVNPDNLDEQDEVGPSDEKRTGDEDQNEPEKSYLQLDMINYTLVRCEGDGSVDKSPQYTLVAASEPSESNIETTTADTVYVLEDAGHKEVKSDEDTHYVHLTETADQRQQVVIMEYEQNAAGIDMQENSEDNIEDSTAPALLAQVLHNEKQPIRKLDARRTSSLPPAHVLLASPNFKLYLYSCRLCSFKCNAVKELSAHKKTHAANSKTARQGRPAAGGVTACPELTASGHTCPRCGLRSPTAAQLQRHIATCREKQDKQKRLAVDALQCAVCSFETRDETAFRKHLQRHRALHK